VNYLATKTLAEVCKYSQINRFIFASTCNVYGASPTPNVKINENSELNPVSLYAEMKVNLPGMNAGASGWSYVGGQ
jgi:UDP-glucose 4-epimerase